MKILERYGDLKVGSYDYNKVVNKVEHDLRDSLNIWREKDINSFTEAVGEICQGNAGEAYFVARNNISCIFPDFDEISKTIIISELMNLYRLRELS